MKIGDMIVIRLMPFREVLCGCGLVVDLDEEGVYHVIRNDDHRMGYIHEGEIGEKYEIEVVSDR